jgi:hypothetical protein
MCFADFSKKNYYLRQDFADLKEVYGSMNRFYWLKGKDFIVKLLNLN